MGELGAPLPELQSIQGMDHTNDDQAFGILEWMMQQFGQSFPPDKIDQFRQLFDEAKKVEDSPWATDKDYQDPAVATMAQRISYACNPPVPSFTLRMVCSAVCGGSLTLKQMFLALLQCAGDHPGLLTIQDRSDWALHFICGGAVEATIGLGQATGAFKEWTDSFDGGDVDPNDYAATFCGARFVQLSAEDPSWLSSWADGSRILATSLPSLTFTETDDERKSGIFTPETINKIVASVNAAYATTKEE